MRILLAFILIFSFIGSAIAARLTDDEFHTEFESAFEQAQYCVEDIKLGSTIQITDPYIQEHVVHAVDVRCSNVIITLYNITKTTNQLEDYIGTDDVRKNKFETMKLGIALFIELIQKYGTKNFPSFQKTWDSITRPNTTGSPSV